MNAETTGKLGSAGEYEHHSAIRTEISVQRLLHPKFHSLVIAIIAILAGLLLPALAKAKEKASHAIGLSL